MYDTLTYRTWRARDRLYVRKYVSRAQKNMLQQRLRGLFSSGAEALMMVNAPFTSPAPPSPATALPTINMLEDTATPQSKVPNSKRARKERKVYFGPSAETLCASKEEEAARYL